MHLRKSLNASTTRRAKRPAAAKALASLPERPFVCACSAWHRWTTAIARSSTSAWRSSRPLPSVATAELSLAMDLESWRKALACSSGLLACLPRSSKRQSARSYSTACVNMPFAFSWMTIHSVMTLRSTSAHAWSHSPRASRISAIAKVLCSKPGGPQANSNAWSSAQRILSCLQLLTVSAPTLRLPWCCSSGCKHTWSIPT
mmetsp:Transcript_124546/g.387794  ORF Transcript_124546/g.387794 Transcript_124546/m.387794 type:complete len:202 (+) Transcript_124546:724-1329(+)